jgi:hypothetical protein
MACIFISRILKNDCSLYYRMGRNARPWAEIHHSPQSGAKRIENNVGNHIFPENMIKTDGG